MKKWIFAGIILIFVIMSGCTSNHQNIIAQDCINLCVSAKQKGMNLSNGPCLSDNNSEWQHEGWVCDVAHKPRIAVDNLPENQCQEFRRGKANHFIEVNENCEIIKVW